jgi:hypothetical protein
MVMSNLDIDFGLWDIIALMATLLYQIYTR